MLSIITAKIKSYVAIAVAIIIAILIAALSIQFVRLYKLKSNIENLKLENERSKKEALFLKSQIQIIKNFESSTLSIQTITNETIFDSQKQMAIKSIVEDFYKDFYK